MSDYIISDEPTPGLQQRFVVNPMLPLFYFMFGTTLVAWGWLAFNAYAMGSGKRVREWGILAFGAVMSVIITLGIFFLVTADVFPDIYDKYVVQCILLWKLAITYWVVIIQFSSFGLYEYLNPQHGKNSHGLVFFFVLMFLSFRGTGALAEQVPMLFRIALG